MYVAREHTPMTCYASKEPTRRKTLREINSTNRGVFEQGNFGGYKGVSYRQSWWISQYIENILFASILASVFIIV
jgi:hypothetical protein